MADTELAFAPARVQAELVRRREVSPIALVDLYLERIERLNPQLGAYFTVAAEQARETARRAEAVVTRRVDLPPFHGVPISIKDLADTAGIRTTHGARAWNNRVPHADAEVVTRIKQAGFVILGKTSTPELGAAPVTEPPGFPPARNPWDPSRTPGGSSGGAAAALAAGLCAVSHGSDAGGSIRVPSALCGLVGMKPSRGRVSAAPANPNLIITQGAIGRTVADAAAVLDVIAGPTTGDAYWAPPPEHPFADEAGRPPGRLRVAWTVEPFAAGVEVAAGNRAVASEAAALLEELGHDVEQAAPRWDRGAVGREAMVFGVELAAREELPPFEAMDPVNRFMIEVGRTVLARDYVAAREQMLSEARRAITFFDRYDVLLTPTVPIPAPPVGEYTTIAEMANLREFLVQSMVSGDMPRFGWLAAFTSPWNVTGQPAVSVPFGFADGLPVGIQLVGRPADEATLVRLAAQLEQARPWSGRRPPVS